MNKNANAQLRMMSAVVNYLETEVENMTKVPALQAKFEQLKSIKTSIWDITTQRMRSLKGVTQDKDEHRERVNEVGLQLSAALVAHAKEQNDAQLEVLVDFTYSDLKRGAVNHNLDRLEILLLAAKELSSEELNAVGWDDARLGSFEEMVSTFTAQMTAPREAIANRSVLTKRLYELLDEAKALFEDYLDKLVIQLKASEPSFVEGYFSTRKVIPFGSRSSFLGEQQGEDDSGGAFTDESLGEDE